MYQEREQEIETLKNTHQKNEDLLRQQIANAKRRDDDNLTLEQREHIETYSKFINQGEALKEFYKSSGKPFSTLNALYKLWDRDVKNYLHNFIDPSQVIRFIDSHNEIPLYPGRNAAFSEEDSLTYDTLSAQILLLKKFIKEIRESAG
jgi:hypothetical protein